MQLTTKILSILNSMLPPETPIEGVEYLQTVLYDSAWSTNVRIDRRPTPAALLYLVTDWNLDISHGTSKEAAELEVFFFDRAKFDAKGEEKDVIVSKMEAFARDFLGRVLSDPTIKVTDDSVRLRSSYGQFDAFVVGVSVHIKLELKQGECI